MENGNSFLMRSDNALYSYNTKIRLYEHHKTHVKQQTCRKFDFNRSIGTPIDLIPRAMHAFCNSSTLKLSSPSLLIIWRWKRKEKRIFLNMKRSMEKKICNLLNMVDFQLQSLMKNCCLLLHGIAVNCWKLILTSKENIPGLKSEFIG